MRQKYELVKNDQDQVLIIKEFAELDKELMSLMCEETYPFEIISAAISRGKEPLIRALRTKNLYPPSIYADKIAASVMALFSDQSQDALALFFDDTELLTVERRSAEILDDTRKDPEDVDALLEDSGELLDPDEDPMEKSGDFIQIEDED